MLSFLAGREPEIEEGLVEPVHEPGDRDPSVQEHVDQVGGGEPLQVLDALLAQPGLVPGPPVPGSGGADQVTDPPLVSIATPAASPRTVPELDYQTKATGESSNAEEDALATRRPDALLGAGSGRS